MDGGLLAFPDELHPKLLRPLDEHKGVNLRCTIGHRMTEHNARAKVLPGCIVIRLKDLQNPWRAWLAVDELMQSAEVAPKLTVLDLGARVLR